MTEPDAVPLRVQQLVRGAVRPPGEAIPPGCSDATIREFEKRSGLRLTSAVSAWLRFTNGPCVGPGGLYGIRPDRDHLDIEAILANYPGWAARGWFPFAGDGCGNHYVVDGAAGGVVLFVDTIEDPAVGQLAAPTIWTFIEATLEKDQESA